MRIALTWTVFTRVIYQNLYQDCLMSHATTDNGVFIPKFTDLYGAWRSRAQNRDDAQVAFSLMELSYFEFTKTHLHLQIKEFLASAALSQQRTAASAKLCFSTQFTCSTHRKYPYCGNCASPAGGSPCVLLWQSPGVGAAGAYGRGFSAGFGTSAFRNMSQAGEFLGQESCNHSPDCSFLHTDVTWSHEFFTLVANTATPAKRCGEASFHSPHTARENCRCLFMGGRERQNPKCQHFRGVNPLYFWKS